MNFKILLLFILLSGCGVKGDPSAPKNSYIPSVMENYPEIETDKPVNDSQTP